MRSNRLIRMTMLWPFGITILTGVAGSYAEDETFLHVSITSDGQPAVFVAPGEALTYTITAVLSDSLQNEGLCHFHFDLSFSGGSLSPVDKPSSGPLTAFVAPNGTTNPVGYGGTIIDGRLIQIGGTQNVLKMSGPPPLPAGTVITGLAHAPLDLATGTLIAPNAPGVYLLSASELFARVLEDGEDGSGEFWASKWAWGGNLQPLTVTVRPCELECADADADYMRDDPCVWYECEGTTCSPQPIVFGDVGGPFGDCTPDGFANLFDRSQVLGCFAETNPCPAIFVDTGGPFGECTPDGFCNLFDVTHTLTSFAGSNTCTCSGASSNAAGHEKRSGLIDASSSGVMRRSGPAIGQHRTPPPVAGQTRLLLAPDRQTIAPGETIRVHVYMRDAVDELQGYQLQLVTSGGSSGQLELQSIDIEVAREDFVLGESEAFYASHLGRAEVMCGTDSPVTVGETMRYLATFQYQANERADGAFVVDVRSSEPHAGHGTYLMGSHDHQVQMLSSSPAVITVGKVNDAK